MIRKIWGIGFVIVPFLFNITQGCLQENTSCNDIKTEGGFQFPHGCPEKSEVVVSNYQNITIAIRKVGTQTFQISDKVFKANDQSIVTRDCQYLKVGCTVYEGDHIKQEICRAFTVKLKNPDPSIPWGIIIGVVLCGGVVLLIVIVIWLRRQPSAATLPKFLRYLWSCSCLKTENAEREETQETGCPQENGVPQVIAGNGVIRMGEISASHPHGSDQNDINPDDTPESVKVDSIDPNADGKTPQPFSLDHNLTNGAIQTTKNGDISAPDANRASYDRTMNRSQRDDPGGINNNKGEDAVRTRERPNGWALGNRGPEDGVDEEKALLSDQGATIQDSDMTGEAAALVNKRGSDPGQDGRCSTSHLREVTARHEELLKNI
ncbi:uncharacterized protein LOC131983562 [Centropristis striata]|uniref:uncharacterized protein LOC131983562 n=1 Tax=Centropristis striata TaxID=184440 RepID=UPI0027E0EB6C|nr:uncharacterized protein LOC131983562 [Centropristis striata]